MNEEQKQQLTELELDTVVGGGVKDAVVTMVNGVVSFAKSMVNMVSNAYNALN